MEKKCSILSSIGSPVFFKERYLVGDFGTAGSGFLTGPYPSHLRPVEVHLLQKGFPSSHLTLRILSRGELVFYNQVVNIFQSLNLLAGDTSCSHRRPTNSISMTRLGLHYATIP